MGDSFKLQPKAYWSSVLGGSEGNIIWRSVPLNSGGKNYWHAAARLKIVSGTICDAAVALAGPEGKVTRLKVLEADLVSGKIKTADEVLDAVQNEVECHDDTDGSAAAKSYLAGWICADVVGRCMQY